MSSITNIWKIGTDNNGNGTNNNQFYISESTDVEKKLTIQRGTGIVGIGTNTNIFDAEKNIKLDINGSINLSGDIYKNGEIYVSDSTTWIENGEKIYYSSGKVGINTTEIDPNVLLEVNGTIKATNIIANGSQITNLNADNIEYGKITDNLFDSNITIVGKFTSENLYVDVISPKIKKIKLRGISGTWDANPYILEYDFKGLGIWEQGNRSVSGTNNYIKVTENGLSRSPYGTNNLQTWVNGGKILNFSSDATYIGLNGPFTYNGTQYILFDFQGSAVKPYLTDIQGLRIYYDRTDISISGNRGTHQFIAIDENNNEYIISTYTIYESNVITNVVGGQTHRYVDFNFTYRTTKKLNTTTYNTSNINIINTYYTEPSLIIQHNSQYDVLNINNNNTRRLTITNIGNVGIGGTAFPNSNYKLDVDGNINSSGTISSQIVLIKDSINLYKSSTQSVLIKLPQTLTSYTITLPNTGPLANNILKSDDNGTLSWVNINDSLTLINIYSFFDSTEFEKTTTNIILKNINSSKILSAFNSEQFELPPIGEPQIIRIKDSILTSSQNFNITSINDPPSVSVNTLNIVNKQMTDSTEPTATPSVQKQIPTDKYQYHTLTFEGTSGYTSTTDGNQRTYNINFPENVVADILIVGGGGGGGRRHGGGGGAGTLIYHKGITLNGTYNVKVGKGGDGVSGGALGGSATGRNATDGKNSEFVKQDGTQRYLAVGGGRGSSSGYNDQLANTNGGQGMIANSSITLSSGNYFNGNLVSVSNKQYVNTGLTYPEGCRGNVGGLEITNYKGGGGGGAGSVGMNHDAETSPYDGYGGDGIAIDISGSSVVYAGGGGGSDFSGSVSQVYDPNKTTIEARGGGGYGSDTGSAQNGKNGTGGGGGGQGNDSGGVSGSGGSGIVIIRYYVVSSITHKYLAFTYTGTTQNDTTYQVNFPVNTTCDILIVAGGGGGGSTYSSSSSVPGAGGGAGGLIFLENQTISAGQYTIKVGRGGDGDKYSDTSYQRGQNGFNSSFSYLQTEAIGGGGGASREGTAKGGDGGSGGGSVLSGESAQSGGLGTISNIVKYDGTILKTSYIQGFNGGETTASSVANSEPYSGGGGGAGEAGKNNIATGVNDDGNGGVGKSGEGSVDFKTLFGITNTNIGEHHTDGKIYFAGGGGNGYRSTPNSSTGGLGGGGNSTSGDGENGLPNTGGGGSGARASEGVGRWNGGNGGSGIVIIRYSTLILGTNVETENIIPNGYLKYDSGDWFIDEINNNDYLSRNSLYNELALSRYLSNNNYCFINTYQYSVNNNDWYDIDKGDSIYIAKMGYNGTYPQYQNNFVGNTLYIKIKSCSLDSIYNSNLNSSSINPYTLNNNIHTFTYSIYEIPSTLLYSYTINYTGSELTHLINLNNINIPYNRKLILTIKIITNYDAVIETTGTIRQQTDSFYLFYEYF